MAEIIVGVIGPVMQLGQWLWSPAKRGLGYMVHYKRNTESLNLQIEKLEEMKNGNQNLVDAFQLNGEEKPEIQMWLRDANKAIADAAQLTSEVAASKNCISGMCPDLRWRYNLGKKAMKEKEAVNKLLEKGDFQTVSGQVPRPIEISSIMSPDFQPFGSTKKAMVQVMTALKDDGVTVIGVYGMGGVGKTTMVEQVGAQARKDGLFDHVIKAVFSQNPNLMKIQGELSDMLDFKLHEETEPGRAARLKERILRGKKTLIILDDIWNESPTLTRIGIPSPNELQKRNSKVLITTRRWNVCHCMECNVQVELSVLSEEDSWNLFAKKARKSFESVTFYNVARKVARECAGLPIALIAVARAIGDKDLDEWKEAARRLAKSQPANLEDDGAVFKCIKLSYDYLKSKDAKSCFLLCSLFAEDSDIPIQDLFRYGFGLGLFRDGNTLEEARAEARSVTKYLKASSLLLDGVSEEYVRMHDVIRDMAILIASSEHGHRFLVKAGWELNDWPNDTDEGCSAISLTGNYISKLPDELVCPKLQILLLNDNPTVEEIPEAFFQSLNALRVLDLAQTDISILPSSFNFLINLQTLRLDGCGYFEDISVLGKLKKLEILSLRDSSFEKFPEEIGNLANLRLLDLSWNSLINIIPSKVISRLSRLEELLMEGSFGDWGGKVEGAGERINAGFDELTCLSYLNILFVQICNVECIPKDVGFLPNWEKFFICIKSESLPVLHTFTLSACPRRLVLETTIDTLPSWFKSVVVERTEAIFYSECRGLNNFLVEYATERLHGLISLRVQECNHMPSLMNTTTTSVPNRPVLEKLEELDVNGLNDLKELCVGDLPHGSLGNLKLLEVKDCNALEGTLLQPNLWQKLQNLEELNIEGMSRMEYVFESEGLKQEQAAFRNWREMKLAYLEELKSIWNGPPQYAIFHNLKVLTVSECRKLKTIFTTDASHCLMQLELEELRVDNCSSLETIIGASEGTLEDKIIFPQLRRILLRILPELKSFYCGGSGGVECPSLEYLYVRGCHSQFSKSASDFHSQKQVQVVDTGAIPLKRK